MAVLSREHFDSLEFDAAASGDHAPAARQMSWLAATGEQGAGMSRAEAFLRAGEQWLLADDPAQAAEEFQRALDDGGPVFVDPRVPLARAMFQLGRTADAQSLLGAVRTDGAVSPRACDMTAELLVERGDLASALDWATVGVAQCLADRQDAGEKSELMLLLRLRYRIRIDLGLPEDDYDKLLDASS